MSVHREHHCNESIKKDFHRGSVLINIGKFRTQCQQDTLTTDSSHERGIGKVLTCYHGGY